MSSNESPLLRTKRAEDFTNIPSPLRGFGKCRGVGSWGWQKAPAPGYMPEPLRGKVGYQRHSQLHHAAAMDLGIVMRTYLERGYSS